MFWFFFIQFSFVGPHIEHINGAVFNNELLDYQEVRYLLSCMHVVNIETIGLVGFLTSSLTLNVGVKTFLTSNTQCVYHLVCVLQMLKLEFY
jgi:hypothetical protein